MYQRVILFLLMALAVLLEPSSAHAQSLGDSIESFLQSLNDTPQLVKTVAYVMGIALGIWGIFKIKDHVDAPMQTPLRAGILRLIGGGMLLSLPMVTEALYNTLNSGGGVFANTSRHSVTVSGSMSLDEVMIALVSDIGQHMESFVQAFCYIFGLIFTVVGAIRLTKHQQEGPRGPSGMGTLTTFIVAGALFSLANMMGAFSQSLFGSSQTFTYAAVNFSGSVSATAETHIEVVTEAVLGFMMILGWISFARGWFILKAVADGGGQASLMAGITHIIGGALAVNLGHLINAVQDTLGLTPFGITMS